ncbi:hypothetical protein MRX96_035493 [Rhipicephalus microplus]
MPSRTCEGKEKKGAGDLVCARWGRRDAVHLRWPLRVAGHAGSLPCLQFVLYRLPRSSAARGGEAFIVMVMIAVITERWGNVDSGLCTGGDGEGGFAAGDALMK